ncbi:MAG: DUF2460 domain-containing protein [Erysipelotrichaceae bacterium]|nr:DUF2460 domain-containing protein [Erysipelotrichaceae bacterium]
MAEFPAVPSPNDPVSVTPVWKTNVTNLDSGKEQRRQKWSFPKYDISLNYDTINPQSNMQILWDFYMARKGSAEAFYFYFRRSGLCKSQYVAYGDGILTTFDLPGKSTSSQVIRIDGSAQGGGYSILTGGGDANSDRVQFVAAPLLGQLIICDFTGFFRNRCRFEEDRMTEERFYLTCYKTSLKLKGLSFEI